MKYECDRFFRESSEIIGGGGLGWNSKISKRNSLAPPEAAKIFQGPPLTS